MKKNHGFTLIELLIVIGIIAFLASAIFIAVDPAKRFAESRNARRWTDTSAVLEAVLQYAVDQDGTLPSGIDDVSSTVQILGTNASGCEVGCAAKPSAVSCLDLSDVLIPKYLGLISYDPYTGSPAFTDYYINRSSTGRLEVGSCDPELGATIFVSR
ncbi:type II secretion system GspH family protein [Patescibacteria group bacterium]|nr:type II secretion system GspH family protein [Patescibacteria group bacterium]